MADDLTPPLVTGEIVIRGTVPSFQGGTAYIVLEQTTFADAPATVVADTAVYPVEHPKPGEPPGSDSVWPFALQSPPEGVVIEPRERYEVRVRVEPGTASGKTALALYSTESYPVLTYGRGAQVQIVLESPPDSGA